MHHQLTDLGVRLLQRLSPGALPGLRLTREHPHQALMAWRFQSRIIDCCTPCWIARCEAVSSPGHVAIATLTVNAAEYRFRSPNIGEPGLTTRPKNRDHLKVRSAQAVQGRGIGTDTQCCELSVISRPGSPPMVLNTYSP